MDTDDDLAALCLVTLLSLAMLAGVWVFTNNKNK